MADGKASRDQHLLEGVRPFSEQETALLSELAADLSRGIAAIRGRIAKAAAEQELRESEERYRNLFESMDEGFAPAR